MKVTYDVANKKLAWEAVPDAISYSVFCSKEGGQQNMPISISPSEEAARSGVLNLAVGKFTMTVIAKKKVGNDLVEIDKGSVDITVSPSSRLATTRDWLMKKWPIVTSCLLFLILLLLIGNWIIENRVRTNQSSVTTLPSPSKQLINRPVLVSGASPSEVATTPTKASVDTVPSQDGSSVVLNNGGTKTNQVAPASSRNIVGNGNILVYGQGNLVVNGNNNVVNFGNKPNDCVPAGESHSGNKQVAVWPQGSTPTRTFALDDCFVQSDQVDKFTMKTVILPGEDIQVPIPPGFGVSVYSPASADQLQIALDGEIRNPYPGNTTPINRYPSLQKNEYRFRLKDGVPSAELELTFYRR